MDPRRKPDMERPMSAVLRNLTEGENVNDSATISRLSTAIDRRGENFEQKIQEHQDHKWILEAELAASRRECEAISKIKQTKENQHKVLLSAVDNINKKRLKAIRDLEQERIEQQAEKCQLRDEIKKLGSLSAAEFQMQSSVQSQSRRAKEGIQSQNAETGNINDRLQFSLNHIADNEKEIGWHIYLIRKMGKKEVAIKKQVSQLIGRKAALKQEKACLKRQLKDALRKLQKEKKGRQLSDRTLRLNLGPEASYSDPTKKQSRSNRLNSPQRLVKACEDDHDHTNDCVLISYFENHDEVDDSLQNNANARDMSSSPYKVVDGRVPCPLFRGGKLLGAAPEDMHLVQPHFAYNPNCSPAARAKRLDRDYD